MPTNQHTQQQAAPRFKAIDFFCGGGGMTCGLRQAGIDVVAGVDFDKNAKANAEFFGMTNGEPNVSADKYYETLRGFIIGQLRVHKKEGE